MGLFVGGAAILLLMIIGLSTVSWYWVGLIVLFAAGFGEAGFASMQATIMFTASPPKMRSRNMGILVVCIGFGPLGILHTGAMAQWLGADLAVGIIAFEGLIGTLVCLWLLPTLRKAAVEAPT